MGGKVGTRKDFVGSVSDALRDIGLCKTTAGGDYDVFWGEQWTELGQFMSPNIKANAVVSSIPEMKSLLGEKPALARIHRYEEE